MQHYMELIFPIKRLAPRRDFSDKIENLGLEPSLPRIFVDIEILDDDQNVVFSTDAIFDTGAPFSLFSKSILRLLGNKILILNSIHGIINISDCSIDTGISNVLIRLVDSKNNKSKAFKCLVAFSDNENLPFILGMNGILNNNHISIEIANNNLKMKFNH